MDGERSVLKRFVALEGLDGSGTTTQLRMLDRKMTSLDIPHTMTCEPTDRPVGRLIRDVLEHRIELHAETLALLFAADRSDHVRAENGIVAQTSEGRIVVSDRYVFSSLAYQGLLCGLEFVSSINSGFPLPEAVVFIDAPPEICQERRSLRGKPDLYEDLVFQRRVRESYLEVFSRYTDTSMRLIRLDGTKKVDELAETLWSSLRDLSIIRA